MNLNLNLGFSEWKGVDDTAALHSLKPNQISGKTKPGGKKQTKSAVKKIPLGT